jgi:hypothetical protein
VNLLQLVNKGGKEFIFNEFGIGGGVSPSGDAPARTVEQVGRSPALVGRRLQYKAHLQSIMLCFVSACAAADDMPAYRHHQKLAHGVECGADVNALMRPSFLLTEQGVGF